MATAPTEFCLGASQQAWHMAMAACESLGLDYSETAPIDIEVGISILAEKCNAFREAIAALQRENAELRSQVDILRRGGC